MTSMVERVARAIANVDCGDYELRPNTYNATARAAIEAMRVPTDAMKEARFQRLGEGGRIEWEAMIDAALAEAPQ